MGIGLTDLRTVNLRSATVVHRMSDIVIREGVDEDAEALVDLIGRIYAEYGQRLDISEEPHLLTPCSYFREHGGMFWVAVGAGRVVGCCGVRRAGVLAELKTLYVDASVRRRSIATRLVARVMAFARSVEAVKVILWSDTRFLAAHRLYRRLGFELDGLRELKDSNRSWEYGFQRSPRADDEGCHRSPEPADDAFPSPSPREPNATF